MIAKIFLIRKFRTLNKSSTQRLDVDVRREGCKTRVLYIANLAYRAGNSRFKVLEISHPECPPHVFRLTVRLLFAGVTLDRKTIASSSSSPIPSLVPPRFPLNHRHAISHDTRVLTPPELILDAGSTYAWTSINFSLFQYSHKKYVKMYKKKFF